MRRRRQLAPVRPPPGVWLGLLLGATLAARAEDPAAEQAAFDRYFQPPAPPRQGDWSGHFSFGAMVGLNLSAKFSEQGLFALPGASLAPGVYDDGYVLPDQTGNSGQTTDWGYQSAAQYNAAAQTLTMHRTSAFQISDGSSADEGGPFPGFELAYGGTLHRWQNLRLGWDFGFDLMPVMISDHATLAATVNQSAYTFGTGGVVPPPPGYQGAYSGSGPLLGTAATSSAAVTTGTVSGSRSLDLIIYGFRLGPTLDWDFSRNCSLSLGAGPAMGLVSGQYKYDELVSTAASSARASGGFQALDVVWGGDVSATLLYHTTDAARPVDLYLSAHYMPLGSAGFSQGGRSATLDLSGQVYLSAGVNWPF